MITAQLIPSRDVVEWRLVRYGHRLAHGLSRYPTSSDLGGLFVYYLALKMSWVLRNSGNMLLRSPGARLTLGDLISGQLHPLVIMSTRQYVNNV